MLHLLFKQRLHGLILVLEMAMELLGLGRNLALQGIDLLSVMPAELLKVGLKSLLLCQQLLHLVFQRMDTVGNIVLHGRL